MSYLILTNMQASDFTTTITVDQTPTEVFDIINSPREWWSGEFEGDTKNLGDEFTYRYQDMHYSKQRVVESIPGEKVVWLVTESEINFVEDKNEWTGTKIIFDISRKDEETQIKFTHLGLDTNVECFEGCSTAWKQLIEHSLFTLITTGAVEKPAL
ncbi:SRPBCC domain-containing protein [Mucilaginibacter sp. HD30]